MYAAHRMPVIDSSAKSVEEMATMIMQSLKLAPKERQ
jgi:regulator of PEP synthase PpsR (kinase-PPPase family)